MDKVLKYLPWAIIVMVCLLFLNYCSDADKERKDHDKNMAYANQMIYNNRATWKLDSTAQGQKFATQEILYLEEKEAKEMGLIENNRLRKINQETKIIIKTQVERVYVPITDTFTVTNGDTVQVRSFSLVDEWNFLYGKVYPNKALVDSMGSNHEIVMTVGYKPKKHFWKKDTLVVDVSDKNPKSKIEGVYNVSVKPRKKMFFEQTWFKLTVGAAGGFWIRSKIK